ncbi:MAG: TonB-dependent receptor plug domain-containing protein [Gammaproteobacteria bacterium]|nr:TonB-dependent receptor plug domain-containing protein [Gammaproteobacteria bacterium]
MSRFFLCFSLVFALFLISVADTVFAQENVGEESTIRYPAGYFSEWAPVTAQDMLDRIPGLDVGNSGFGGSSSRGPSSSRSRGGSSGRGGGRGFGGGSRNTEILINGKRTAGKNNSTGGQLSRITSGQVDRIEIIRGTSGELDVRGSGQVVNVVLNEQFNEASLQYDFNAEQSRDNTLKPGAEISYNGQRGGLNYQASVRAFDPYFYTISREYSMLGDFSPNDKILEIRKGDPGGGALTTNLDYEINQNSSARFNATWTDGRSTNDTLRKTTNLKVSPHVENFQIENSPGIYKNWEVGGDYEFNTVAGSRWKILFITNSLVRANTRERYDVLGESSQEKNLYLDSWNETKERIVRGSYTFDIFKDQDIEIGAERAQTILDSKLALGISGIEGTPSPAVGGLIPMPVSNANSTVEEMRYEPFIIHNWIFNARTSLETSILYEDSEITQRGDIAKQRDFSFVKPKVDFRYDLTPQLQLRGMIEKIVEQLTFNDFVAASDDQDEDSNVQAGNANLRQEWFWNYEINAEYRLPNDIGVLSGRVYYEDWHDRIERIDVTVDESQLQSANGNIGDGERYGLNVSASMRMRMIGMPNLLVSASAIVEDTKVIDPILGDERRMMGMPWRGRSNWAFRHDLPSLNLNYGMNLQDSFDGGRLRYDIDDIEYGSGDPFWGAFVEWIGPQNITFRLEAQQIIEKAKMCRERHRFVGRISSGILEEIEDQCSRSGPIISLKMTGTF